LIKKNVNTQIHSTARKLNEKFNCWTHVHKQFFLFC
jgi:hypothetical protein